MVVANTVFYDSRVQKTALAARQAGYRVTVVGVSPDAERTEDDLEGARVVRVPPHRIEDIAETEPIAGQQPPPEPWTRRKELRRRWRLVVRRAQAVAGRHPLVRRLHRRVSVRLYDPVADERKYRGQIALLGAAFRMELAELDFDLIHAHDFTAIECAAHAVRTAADSRPRPALVYDAHEWVRGLTHFPAGRLAAGLALEGENIAAADAVVTVSPVLAEHLQSDYGLAERPELVLNAPVAGAADPESPLSVRARAGVPEDVPLAVYSGAVKAARGVQTIIEALPVLPELHLVIVAGSLNAPGVHEVVDLARRLHCADRVHVVPYVPYDQVINDLRTATLGIHPMLPSGNAELALPNKIFEYLHAGLPMVVSDMPAMGGLITERGWGESFAAGDAHSLADAVRRVLVDPDRYREALEDPASRHEFSWERQAETLVGVYDRLLLGDAADPDRHRLRAATGQPRR